MEQTKKGRTTTSKKVDAKKTVAKKATAKKPTAKEKKIDQAQKVVATQKVVSNRKLKYIYPEGMTDTLKRKSFRQTVRAKLDRLEKAMLKAEGRKKTIASKKFKEYQAEVLA